MMISPESYVEMELVGIPFGKQFFKIARLSLFPFGAKVVKV